MSTRKLEQAIKARDEAKRVLDQHQGKKPFRPSPVISPVYGILDKNYTADEIVDKTDGMKRETKAAIVRTPDIESRVNTKPEEKTIEEAYQEYEVEEKELSIDSVRNKAYGNTPEVKEIVKEVEPEVEEDIDEISEDSILQDIEDVIEETNDDVMESIPELPDFSPIEDEEEVVEEETEEELTSRFVRDDSVTKEHSTLLDEDEDDDASYIPDDYYEDEEETENYEGESLLDVSEEKVNKSHILDDMEKTSTLQILDDIEKELNSIKNVASDTSDDEDYTLEERLERNDTLENDLFNLIDSMYDNGEEDEEDND